MDLEIFAKGLGFDSENTEHILLSNAPHCHCMQILWCCSNCLGGGEGTLVLSASNMVS